MAHEIRAFERSFRFASWLAWFGWRVVGAWDLHTGQAQLDVFGPQLARIHALPWAEVWQLYSAVVDMHAALFAASLASQPGDPGELV